MRKRGCFGVMWSDFERERNKWKGKGEVKIKWREYFDNILNFRGDKEGELSYLRRGIVRSDGRRNIV